MINALFVIYVVIQAIGAIVMATRVTEVQFFRSMLVLPILWDYYRNDLNLAGAIIATGVTTLFFLPAMLFCYVMWVAIIVVGFIIFSFKEIFKKREEENKNA